MHPFGTPLVIAAPAVGSSRSATLSRLSTALDARGQTYDVRLAEAPGHVEHITREAAEAGRRYFVAVGDDGTVHEVVNGLVDPVTGAARVNDPVLAVVGVDRPADLARTFGLDRRPEILAGHIVSEDVMPIDLGRARLSRGTEAPESVVFANIAQVGFGAAQAAAHARMPRRLGGFGERLGTAVTAARFRPTNATVSVDGGSRTEPVCNVVVANGQFLPRGLLVAPRALPSDGRFNVQSWGGSVREVLRMQPLLRQGAHLQRDDVREWQSTTVEVVAERPLAVEADGRLIGATPARFDVLAGVLRLKT